MPAEMRRNKLTKNYTLSDKIINIIDEVTRLKREVDKAQGYYVARGSREEFTRYSRSQAIQDLVEKGAPDLIRELNKKIEDATKVDAPTENTNLKSDEAIKRKIMDMDGKGWTPLGGAPGW